MTTLNIPALIEESPLFIEALTHKSADKHCNFERLEFLGDALLGYKISFLLCSIYPQESEGSLSRWRSSLVNQKSLAEISQEIGLLEYFRAQKKQLEALRENPRIQAALFESFLAAYSKVKGEAELDRLMEELFLKRVKEAKKIFEETDYKTLLQEKSQALYKTAPIYAKEREEGPSHDRTFLVSVTLEGKKWAEAEGASLKEAEFLCAKKALLKIEEGKKYE